MGDTVNHLKNVVGSVTGVGGTGSVPSPRWGLLDIFSEPRARNEQKSSSFKVRDYTEIFSSYGYNFSRRVDPTVVDNVDVEFHVPYIHRVPGTYRQFLFRLGASFVDGIYFVPRFDVRRNENRLVIEEGQVWAGRYHPRYGYAHDVEYASKKIDELRQIVRQLDGRLYGFRRDDYNFSKETFSLEPRWEGVKFLPQRVVYVNRFLFTLPEEVSDFAYLLFLIGGVEIFEKFIKDLKDALVRTLYRLVWYQLRRDAPDVAGDRFVYRKFRDRFVVSALVNIHLTHSFHVKSLDIDDYELLLVDENEYRRRRSGRQSDVFAPHIHFHVLLPNFVYDKHSGLFIRLDFYYDNEIVRRYWKSEVLRVVRRYNKYVYESVYSKEFAAGTDKAWKLDNEKAFGEVFHFIKYSHRSPVYDILLYFEFNNDKETLESVFERYDLDWLRYVTSYSNRTYPYGVFANPGRYGFVFDEVMNEEEDVETDVDENVIERDVPYSLVFRFYLDDKDCVIVEDKVGKSSRWWLYTRLRRVT